MHWMTDKMTPWQVVQTNRRKCRLAAGNDVQGRSWNRLDNRRRCSGGGSLVQRSVLWRKPLPRLSVPPFSCSSILKPNFHLRAEISFVVRKCDGDWLGWRAYPGFRKVEVVGQLGNVRTAQILTLLEPLLQHRHLRAGEGDARVSAQFPLLRALLASGSCANNKMAWCENYVTLRITFNSLHASIIYFPRWWTEWMKKYNTSSIF
jgi:hypothetical protein